MNAFSKTALTHEGWIDFQKPMKDFQTQIYFSMLFCISGKEA